MDDTYQNIHTGRTLKLVKVETVKNYPNPITVYVLEDGSRWNTEQFKKNWRKV